MNAQNSITGASKGAFVSVIINSQRTFAILR